MTSWPLGIASGPSGGFGPTCDHNGNCLKGLKAPRVHRNVGNVPGLGELWHHHSYIWGLWFRLVKPSHQKARLRRETWGAAPSSVKLLWVPVCPTAISSNNSTGLCWTAPMCPGRNTIISLRTPTERGQGADGSQGASGTSLSWTLQGQQWHQGYGPILPIHPNHGALLGRSVAITSEGTPQHR